MNKNIALRNLARHRYPRQRIIVLSIRRAGTLKWRTYICNAETKKILERGDLCESRTDSLDNLLTKFRELAKVK